MNILTTSLLFSYQLPKSCADCTQSAKVPRTNFPFQMVPRQSQKGREPTRISVYIKSQVGRLALIGMSDSPVKLLTNACAWVPFTGMPKLFPARTLLVPSKPAKLKSRQGSGQKRSVTSTIFIMIMWKVEISNSFSLRYYLRRHNEWYSDNRLDAKLNIQFGIESVRKLTLQKETPQNTDLP